MTITGYIPEKVVYILSASKRNVSSTWDGLEKDIFKQFQTQPIFIADNANSKTQETGHKWATNYNTPKGYVVQTVTRDNEPISGVRVVALEIRDEGGRAYKAILPGNYYVDIREDVLLDLILTEGIQPGGTLNGTYIWGILGSQMKLIRVGSHLHEALKEAGINREKKNLTAKDWEVGKVYVNRKGVPNVYLGMFDTLDVKQTDERRSSQSSVSSYYSYSRYENYRIYKPEIRKKAHLWLDLGAYTKADDRKKIQEEVNEALLSMQYGFFRYEFKNATVIESVALVELPDDIIGAIRTKAAKHLKQIVDGNVRNYASKPRPINKADIAEYAKWLCISEPGALSVPAEVKQYFDPDNLVTSEAVIQ